MSLTTKRFKSGAPSMRSLKWAIMWKRAGITKTTWTTETTYGGRWEFIWAHNKGHRSSAPKVNVNKLVSGSITINCFDVGMLKNNRLRMGGGITCGIYQNMNITNASPSSPYFIIDKTSIFRRDQWLLKQPMILLLLVSANNLSCTSILFFSLFFVSLISFVC